MLKNAVNFKIIVIEKIIGTIFLFYEKIKTMSKFTIPKPCHENWANMLPDEKGKFCASCQKSVHDFTQSSSQEIKNIFEKENGNICGRIIISEKIEFSKLQQIIITASQFTQKYFSKFGSIASAATFLLIITGCQRKLIQSASQQNLKDKETAKIRENNSEGKVITKKITLSKSNTTQIDSVEIREIEEVYVTGIVRKTE